MNNQQIMHHTPGPWHTQHNDERAGELVIADENMYWVASVMNDGEDEEEQRANAHLIAASPMLLAVVQHVLAMADDAYFMGHPEWASIVEQARSAIQHQNHEEN